MIRMRKSIKSNALCGAVRCDAVRGAARYSAAARGAVQRDAVKHRAVVWSRWECQKSCIYVLAKFLNAYNTTKTYVFLYEKQIFLFCFAFLLYVGDALEVRAEVR